MQREKIRSGRRRVKSLKARVGRGSCISRGKPDRPGQTVELYKLEESEEEDTLLVGMESSEEAGSQQTGQLQE